MHQSYSHAHLAKPRNYIASVVRFSEKQGNEKLVKMLGCLSPAAVSTACTYRLTQINAFSHMDDETL